MRYIKALNIGQALKIGIIGIGFFGVILFMGYLVIWSIGEILFKILIQFVSLHPSLSSPFGYLLGVFLMLGCVYLAGIILNIRVHEESLNQKIVGFIPGGKFLFSLFQDFKTGIHSIKNCSFILVKNRKEADWEDADFIALGVLYDGKQPIRLPGGKIIIRPTINVSIPPNPATGFLTWPHKDCVLLLKTPRIFLIKALISFGVIRPSIFDADEDQSRLAEYFS
ncbi:MAG: hypothetical protein Q8O83_02255 [bacterium]|nr:hypothetical protein [bacterium]